MAGLCSLAVAPRAVTSSPSATKEPFATPSPASSRPRQFPKSARVLRSPEFRKIYDTGIRLSSPLFAAFLLARPEPEGARLGITVPRAFGPAVDRNRAKRRLREAFRLMRPEFGNYDIVLNPRRPILKASFEEIRRALGKLMERTK